MKEESNTDSESYAVLEMPVGLNSIRMPLAELKRFCKEYKLPIFTLKVEVTINHGLDIPLANPYRKYFTLKWDWCLYAAEKIDEPEVRA